VRALGVVVAEPAGQCSAELVRGAVGPRVGPLAKQRLDEALDLAVGARPIRPGPQVADAELATGLAEGARELAGAVVGQHRSDAHAAPAEPAHYAMQKGDGALGALVGHRLGQRHAGAVVDGGVDELPAHAPGAPSAIAMDAMANSADPAEFLGVEVHELTGPLPLVATHRRLGRKP
jgi:hypothetical protein